jgi:ParB/RepB/Spo0J family partition protein
MAPTQSALATLFGTTQSMISKLVAAGDSEPHAPVAEISATRTDDFALIDLWLIAPSNFNPRRTFDAAEIASLAESIAANGLLQNLVVTPLQFGPNGDEKHFIIAGERRYRALKLLAEDGGWPHPVRCLVMQGGHGENIALALLENIQRVDVPPLEEAEAFVSLMAFAPTVWTTASIANAIGRTQRFVQQRIALATKLSPLAREALANNKITLEAARLLTAHDEQTQTDVLDDFNLPDVTDAIGADDMRQWLPDPDRNPPSPLSAPDEPMDDDVGPGHLDDDYYPIEQSIPQVAPRTPPSLFDSVPEPTKPNGPPFTKAHIYHAHKRKAAAMQAAVMSDHRAALRIACMALLAAQEAIHIGRNAGWVNCAEDNPTPLLIIEERIARILGKIKSPEYIGDTKKQIALWNRLCALNETDLADLFDSLVARTVRNPAGYDCNLADNPLSLAIAESLNLPDNEDDNGLTLIRDDLAGLRKSYLLRIADDAGTPGVNDATPIGELIEAIATKSADRAYVLPTLRFGTENEIMKGVGR